MTDAPDPGQQPNQPSYPPAGGATPPAYSAPSAPSYSGAQGYAAPAAKKTPILSILSLVFGGLGFLGGAIVFIPFIGSVLGLFFPAAGVVLGFMGRKKEPQAPKGLWIAGIVLGFIGLLFAIIGFIGWGVLFANCSTPGACTTS